MIELYPYQIRLKREVYNLIREGEKRILTVAMTGSGKSIILASIVKDALSRNRKCLILVTRAILVDQLSRSLKMFDIEHGFVKAGKEFVEGYDCYVGTLQSFAKRDLPISFDFLIVDEAHETTFHKTFDKILEQCHDPWILGFTASPWRLSKKEGLTDKYDKAVYAPLTSELIELGFLVKGIYFGFSEKPILTKVRMQNGDYRESDLAIACNTEKLVAHIVEQFRKICPSRKAICFAVNIDHSKAIEKAFCDQGFLCRHVDGRMSEKERRLIYDQLEKGEIQILTSCNVTTTGFDVKSIDCVILARPTASRTLHFQQIGRAMRIAPGTGKEDFICLDQAGNVARFGAPENLTLTQIQMDSPGSFDGGDAPMRECPECHFYSSISVKICPNCGHEFPIRIQEKLTPTDDFVRIDLAVDKRKISFFKEIARMCFYKDKDWSTVYAAYKNKFGEWPDKTILYGAVFGGINTEENQMRFARYIVSWAIRKDKSYATVIRVLEGEFDKFLLRKVKEFVLSSLMQTNSSLA